MIRNIIAHVRVQDRPGVPADSAVPPKRHIVRSVVGRDEEVAVAGKDAVNAVGVTDGVAEVGGCSSVDGRAVDKQRAIAHSLGLGVVECTPAGGLELCFDVVGFDAVGI